MNTLSNKLAEIRALAIAIQDAADKLARANGALDLQLLIANNLLSKAETKCNS